MPAPLVTVIIVNWNGQHHLEKCLASLRKQSFQNFKTVIVDNNSSDSSIEYVRSEFPEVSIVELDENYGFCKPNNLEMAKAESKYVCLLNNDTELDEGCFAAMVETIESDPVIGICDAKQVLYDQRDTVFSVGADYTVAGSSVGAGIFTEDQGFDQIRECSIGMAACILYRKEMLDKIGLFDEDFFAGREDVDLSIRALLAGYRIYNDGRAVCYHKVSATRGNTGKVYVRRGQRNLHWVFFKNMPSSLVVRYFFQHIVYTLFTAVFYFRIGRGGSWLMSKWDVIRGIPALRAKRKAVQQLKAISDEEFSQLLTHQWFNLSRAVGKFRRA